MAKRITFQFEDDLDYQMQAIHSTVELFRGLSRHVDGIYRPNRIRKVGEGDPVRNNDIVVGSRLLENLRKVQLSNDLFADNVWLMEITLRLKWRQVLVRHMCIFVQFLSCIKSMDFVNS